MLDERLWQLSVPVGQGTASSDLWLKDFGKKHLFLRFTLSTTHSQRRVLRHWSAMTYIDNDDDDDNNNNKKKKNNNVINEYTW